MATNTPSLEQLTGSIDALPHSLDLLDALPWENPTLEQLDAWGDLDFLDALGNMDNLSSLAVLIAPTASASVYRYCNCINSVCIPVDASVSFAVTTSAEAQKESFAACLSKHCNNNSWRCNARPTS